MREVQASGTAARAEHRHQRSCLTVQPITVEQPSRALGRRCPNLEITIQLFCSDRRVKEVPDLPRLLLRQKLCAELDEHSREVRWLVGTSAAAARTRTSLRQRGRPSLMLTQQIANEFSKEVRDLLFCLGPDRTINDHNLTPLGGSTLSF